MDRTSSPRTRRSFLRGGLLASLAMVAAFGVLPIPDAAASKNDGRKPISIAKRIENFRELCEKVSDGKMSDPKVRRGGTSVTCSGGSMNRTCTFSKQNTRCHPNRTMARPNVPDHTLEPESPYANPATAPSVPLQEDGGPVLT